MNILTFDIEDWYNCDFISGDFAWDKYEVRIYQGVERILEELEKRVHRVKREMGLEEESVEEYKDAIRGSFIEGTTHLKKSKSRGDDPRSRHYKNMKLLLALVALAFLFWVMFGR